jgi:hypothetical protein
MLQSNEGLSRSMASNGFHILTAGTYVHGYAGFQVIADANVKAKTRRTTAMRKGTHDLSDTGVYATGSGIDFVAGYIDLGPYEEIIVASGTIKAFFG